MAYNVELELKSINFNRALSRVVGAVPKQFNTAFKQSEVQYNAFRKRLSNKGIQVQFDSSAFTKQTRAFSARYDRAVKQLANRQINIGVNIAAFTQSLKTAEARYRAFAKRLRSVELPRLSGGVGGAVSGGGGGRGGGGGGRGGNVGSFAAGGALAGRFASRGGLLSGATGDLASFVSPITAGLAGLGVAVTALGINAVQAFAKFERSMDHVLAISRATQTQFEDLTATASHLGITTIFTGEQVAEGMGFLAQAGFDAGQILGGIAPSLTLAQAGMIGLGRSADILSNVLTAFRIPAENSARIADTLAFSAANSNTNVEQLGSAIARAGVLAAALNVPLETTAALLGVFGDAGIQGFIAGRGLRIILQRLSSPLKQAAGDFSRLNIAFRDSNGGARAVTDILFDVINAIDSLPDALDRAQTAQRIFGTEAVLYYQTLASRGVGELRESIEQMGESVGFATSAARIQTDNLLSDVTRLTSAWNGLNRTVGNLKSGPIRDFVQDITTLIRRVDALVQRLNAVPEFQVQNLDQFENAQFQGRRLEDATIDLVRRESERGGGQQRTAESFIERFFGGGGVNRFRDVQRERAQAQADQRVITDQAVRSLFGAGGTQLVTRASDVGDPGPAAGDQLVADIRAFFGSESGEFGRQSAEAFGEVISTFFPEGFGRPSPVAPPGLLDERRRARQAEEAEALQRERRENARQSASVLERREVERSGARISGRRTAEEIARAVRTIIPTDIGADAILRPDVDIVFDADTFNAESVADALGIIPELPVDIVLNDVDLQRVNAEIQNVVDLQRLNDDIADITSNTENLSIVFDSVPPIFEPAEIDREKQIIADARELFRARKLTAQEALALARQRADAGAAAQLVGGNVAEAIASVDALSQSGRLVDGVFQEVGNTVTTVVDAFINWEDRTLSLTDALKNLLATAANLAIQIALLEPLEDNIRGFLNSRGDSRDGGGGGNIATSLFSAFSSAASGSGGLFGGAGGGVGIQGGGSALSGGGIFRPRGVGGTGVAGIVSGGLQSAGLGGGNPLNAQGGNTIQVFSTSLEPQAAGRFAENAVTQAAANLGQVTNNSDLEVY